MAATEKPLLPLSEKETSSGAPGPNPTPRPHTLSRRLAKVALLLGLGYVAVSTLNGSLSPEPRWSGLKDDALDLGAGVDASLGGYWAGVADKGFRNALKGAKHKHGKHDKHGKHKHGHGHDGHDHKHKHKHPHGDHPPPYIPPREAEAIFLSVPNNDSVRATSRKYTSHAHIAGSGWDYLSALQVKAEWEEALGLHVSGPEEHVFDAGSDASRGRIQDSRGRIGVWVDTYYPLLNTPVASEITLHTDPPFHAKLREDIVSGDPDSALRDEVRVFHGLSANGDVTAQYVYAGYGRKRDFELLQEKGVDFAGKIVLARYGGVFRGLKIEAAQDVGAVGVIIFTDPGDDGEFTEANGYEAYPEGPARQPSSVQRGSVQFLSMYPGDPTTPNVPAYRNATRTEGANIPRIPSLPISFEDAVPLLLALNGKGFKGSDLGQEWEGGLGYKGVEYWVGPSEVDVRLRNEVNTRVMPIWNTMATIPGHISDEVVIVGNHRDAWVLGAGDPSSGAASLTELVRGLGQLVQRGWRPMRTIIVASWDAEEYGLIGSTEFAEDHGEWLARNTAVYLNMDESVTGSRFAGGASPSLAWLLRNAAVDVISSADPSKSVWDAHDEEGDSSRWTAVSTPHIGASIAHSPSVELEQADSQLAQDDTAWIKPLGSGSDFTSFLQRYGIAASNIGYTGGKGDAVYHYHSVYDSFHWQEKFADPGFHRHVDAAKVLGLITLRAADSLVLPINTTRYALELEAYLEKVEDIANASSPALEIDFVPLRAAIASALNASVQLDAHRHKVLKRLKKVLPKPKHPKHGHGHRGKRSLFGRHSGLFGTHAHAHCPQHLPGLERGDVPRGMMPFEARPDVSGAEVDKTGWPALPEIPGVPDLPHAPAPAPAPKPTDGPPSPPPPPEPSHPSEPSHSPHPPHPPHRHPKHPPPPPHIPKKDRAELARLFRQVRAINQRVRSFEGGFISEQGIKGREWYRHKGVAPGKWLGYGATTFPALTEAITLEKSVERAQTEADELTELIEGIAARLGGSEDVE